MLGRGARAERLGSRNAGEISTGCLFPTSGRGKFLPKGARPRRARRVAYIALATHYKAFGSARTAPRPRGLDLAGARFALERAWCAKKGSS